jgi:oligopeptide transport system ATP-binding protein
MGLIPATSGSVKLHGEELVGMSQKRLRAVRRNVQIIFQDPYTSLDPRMSVGKIVGEPFEIHPDVAPRGSRRQKVMELLEVVGLNPEHINRYPHQFSGGQRQRIGIARALALNPSLIVADEPVSALDVSVQAQIINLLLDLQDRLKLSMLFVAHDLGVVRHVSDRVAVMYVGRIVEVAPTNGLFGKPMHPYTAALLAAVPKPDPELRDAAPPLAGEVADASNVPKGCAFHPRCPFAVDRCRQDRPELQEWAPGRMAACHRARELDLAGVT